MIRLREQLDRVCEITMRPRRLLLVHGMQRLRNGVIMQSMHDGVQGMKGPGMSPCAQRQHFRHRVHTANLFATVCTMPALPPQCA